MKFRNDLQKRIEKKEQEIRDLEKQLAVAQAYLQALQETIRMLPKEPLGGHSSPAPVLRKHLPDVLRPLRQYLPIQLIACANEIK